MEWYWAALMLIGGIVVLMLMGIPVAFAFLIVNCVGILMLTENIDGISQIIENSTDLLTTFTLAPMPLFVLMGSLFFYTGLAVRIFDTLDKLFGRIPGRLCYVTVAGGTLFSTLTGSSMANTAMLGSLLVPEMHRRGYSRHMSMGPILGTGGLAMIIPPSSLAVLLASISGVDVGTLLVAGLVPGVLLALLYVTAIYLQVRLRPESAPAYDVAVPSLAEKLIAVVTNLVPVGVVVFLVVGLIIFGIATPTEAAAFGVLGVVANAALFRLITPAVIVASLKGTLAVAGMLFLILMNSTVYSQLLAYSGASSGLLGAVAGLQVSRYTLLLLMIVVLIGLGMFMDPMSMIMISTPLFFPLAAHLNFDLVWFALIVLLTLEMSLTTPPFGLLLFIMLGVAPKGTTLLQTALSALPYLACDALLIFLLVLFPAIALYVPAMMR